MDGDAVRLRMWQFESETSVRTWRPVDVPASGTLYDVTDTAAGPCAVGDAGTAVGRASDGTWGVVLDDGPAGRGETLRAVAATDDGERVWFAGSNGALGYYDSATGDRGNCSAPVGVENTFRALAVAGSRGNERVLVADGSGNMLVGNGAGTAVEWDRWSAPGGAPTALATDAGETWYAVDGSGGAWMTTDDEWERVGVEPASGSLYAVCVAESPWVGGDNGRVFESTRTGLKPGRSASWTPFSLGDGAVRALDASGNRLLAGGESGGLFVRNGDWTALDWGGSATIHGVLAGVGVAVGANATVLEARKKSE
ncbi:hypothetical protein DMJ13_14905 [halophilic archaeon]|nr:hypothetical protein DMJ13_14905 [halophilic archaeon]